MTEYKKMYAILCSGISEAMDLMERDSHREAYLRLQKALYDAEDLYVESAPETANETP